MAEYPRVSCWELCVFLGGGRREEKVFPLLRARQDWREGCSGWPDWGLGTEGPVMSQLQVLRAFCKWIVAVSERAWWPNAAGPDLFIALWVQRALINCLLQLWVWDTLGAAVGQPQGGCAELQCKLHLCLLVWFAPVINDGGCLKTWCLICSLNLSGYRLQPGAIYLCVQALEVGTMGEGVGAHPRVGDEPSHFPSILQGSFSSCSILQGLCYSWGEEVSAFAEPPP